MLRMGVCRGGRSSPLIVFSAALAFTISLRLSDHHACGTTYSDAKRLCGGTPECVMRLKRKGELVLSDIGLRVSRSLPREAIAGLLSGTYSLHGGVVRDASGRIVSHLVSVSATQGLSGLIPGAGLLGTILEQGQLLKIGKDIAQVQSALANVLHISMAGAALSGLGLVTSIASVAYLNRRFDQTDAKLAALERDIKGIKDWLGTLQKSKLQFAIDNLRHAETTRDEILRRDMLLQSKREFSTLAHLYKAEWSRCRSVEEIGAVDDLYVLSILGSAIVCSNLGMHEEAAADLRSNVADWSSQARKHAKSLLFSDRPDRFLAAEFVDQLPARTLVALLDYAHETERGIDWIDELRASHARHATIFESLTPLAPARLQRLVNKSDVAGPVTLARTLRTRSALLDANTAHYDFLNEKRISAIAFQRSLEAARVGAEADAICVSAAT